MCRSNPDHCEGAPHETAGHNGLFEGPKEDKVSGWKWPVKICFK